MFRANYDGHDQSGLATIDFAPGVELYPRDRMAVWIEATFSYHGSIDHGGDTSNYLAFGGAAGLAWYWVFDPLAGSGPAWSAGVGAGLSRYRDLDDEIGGATDTDRTAYTDIRLFPTLRFFYFLISRVSVYARLAPTFSYTLTYVDDVGARVDLAVRDRLSVDVQVGFGVAWWLATRDRVVFMRRRRLLRVLRS